MTTGKKTRKLIEMNDISCLAPNYFSAVSSEVSKDCPQTPAAIHAGCRLFLHRNLIKCSGTVNAATPMKEIDAVVPDLYPDTMPFGPHGRLSGITISENSVLR